MSSWRRLFRTGSNWSRSFSEKISRTSANLINPTIGLSSKPSAFPAVVFATAILGGTSFLYQQQENIIADCEPKENSFPHSHHEIAMLLREKLKVPREKLNNLNKTAPRLQLRTVTYPSRWDVRKSVDAQVMDTVFDPSCNIIALFTNWIEFFEDPPGKLDSKIRQLTEYYNNPQKMSLPFISEDKTKSMTITKYRTAEGPRISITMIKENGYTVKDVDAIAQGYIEGFCSDLKPTKSSSDGKDGYLPFQMFNDHDYQERIFRFLEDQHPFSKFAFEFYSDDSSRMNEENEFGNYPPPSSSPRTTRPSARSGGAGTRTHGQQSTTAGNQSELIEELRSLGVEVFDQSNNTKMSWDFLAGYYYVKKDIQDTVINAIRYPDVYEQIARKTRVVYESNRPKAVLLEGPPGTGKTLTARILASQSEVPLIILKLESIVSKWYGDSEKKLAQIMDICNKLPNSIIFIDELDALAQSRDSEQGIHEVSKRTLSVLLQRLEGFHGKNNSILICATNRKEDLDSALLSRFDLMIKYDLPDKDTRVALFQRYAKQFGEKKTSNESAYDILGKISHGLSCRDIKEACEQAERRCASRLIENNKNNQRRLVIAKDVDDVPNLEDYIQTVQMKLQDQKGHGKTSPFSSI